MHIVIACKARSYFSVIIALTAAVSNTDLYHLDYSDQKSQKNIPARTSLSFTSNGNRLLLKIVKNVHKFRKIRSTKLTSQQ